MIALRIADPVITGLIGKWLKAGVMDHGVVARPEAGTPQGGPISPGLANVYLHYVLDLWFEKRAKRAMQGEAYLTRFVDDFVVAFQYKRDAERFDQTLKIRMQSLGSGWPQRRPGCSSLGDLPANGRPRMAGNPGPSSFWVLNTSAASTPRGNLRSSAFRQRKAAGNSWRAPLNG